ncbi:hypothetical protein WDV90_02725 [Xanthomonas translucens pv. undulosa]
MRSAARVSSRGDEFGEPAVEGGGGFLDRREVGQQRMAHDGGEQVLLGVEIQV